jgi:hypothetical protein
MCDTRTNITFPSPRWAEAQPTKAFPVSPCSQWLIFQTVSSISSSLIFRVNVLRPQPSKRAAS